MFERRSLFINVSILLLIQNGILAIIVSHFTPSLSPAMMAALAAGVIAISMATAMMATRIAGSRKIQEKPHPRAGKALARAPALSGADPQPRKSAPRLVALPAAPFVTIPGRDERLQSTDEALDSLESGLRRLASADLSARLDHALPDRFEGMRGDFNHALISLDNTISAITASADMLNSEIGHARERLDDRRIHSLYERPILLAATGDLKDMSEDLHDHATGLKQISAMAGQHAADLKDKHHTVAEVTGTLDNLAGQQQGVGEVAACMRDIAFRANMLSVNASVSAADPTTQSLPLKTFATELRDLAQEAAEVAKRASMVEREIVLSANKAKSSIDSLTRNASRMSEGLETMQSKLTAMCRALDDTAPTIERTASVLDELSRNSVDHQMLDHEWEDMCDRVVKELSIINQNCSRFMKVTIVNDVPPPEHGPPRSRSHLRLVKG